jgi:hypothetical protein
MTNYLPSVRSEEHGPIPNHCYVQAFLAEKLGFEPGFTVHEDDNGNQVLVDAECDEVPSLSTMCRDNPWLTGMAIESMADNLKILSDD